MERPIAININLSTSGSRLGGAAIAAEFHSRYMAEDFPVELWRMWDKDEEFFLDKLKVKNFATKPIFSFVTERLPKKAKSFFLDSEITQKVLEICPKIVHLHNPVPTKVFKNLACQAADKGIKVVASTHGFYEVMYPNYGFKPYEKFLWKQAITKPVLKALKSVDAIASLYPDEKKMLMEIGVPENKIYLTPNGVNPFFLSAPEPSELDAVVEKFNLSLDNPIILFIGNHTANKGLDTVMKIASQLSIQSTVIIGGKLLTPNEPTYWNNQLPSSPAARVIFTDYLTSIEQRALYHLSSMLLFPSLADTLPLTIIEAMASHLPVIAYDVGGISYQLQDGCGILLEPGDFSGYLSAVEMLLSDSVRRIDIAKKAKLRQESIFSWERTADITTDIYRKLISYG
jgi:alpha-maltose-1-phosphate synthase